MPAYQIQPTPNPNSLKFAATREPFIENGMESFNNAEEAADHPLGKALFKIESVDNVLILPAFVTVSKRPEGDWDHLLPAIDRALNDWLNR